MAAAYDSLELVCNAARTRLNDAIASLGGDILIDNAVFTSQMVSNAWRKLQEYLQKLGFLKFTNAVFLSDLPAVSSSTDPSVQPFINWSGYWDGATLHAGFAFPSDFIAPVEIHERITAVGGNYLLMDDIKGDWPLVAPAPWNRIWQWRDETIFIPGGTGAFDLFMKYDSFLADFVPNATTPYASQPVPIMRCSDSFSNYLCAEVAVPRGDLDAKQFVTDAENAAVILASRENPMILTVAPTQPGGPPA